MMREADKAQWTSRNIGRAIYAPPVIRARGPMPTSSDLPSAHVLAPQVHPQASGPAEYGGILDEWYDHTKDPGRRRQSGWEIWIRTKAARSRAGSSTAKLLPIGQH